MRSSVVPRLPDAQFFANICALADKTGRNSSGGFSREKEVLQIVFRIHTLDLQENLIFGKKNQKPLNFPPFILHFVRG